MFGTLIYCQLREYRCIDLSKDECDHQRKAAADEIKRLTKKLLASDSESGPANVVPGLSKRDWFAGLVMQRIATDNVSQDIVDEHLKMCAAFSYAAADAMLEARVEKTDVA